METVFIWDQNDYELTGLLENKLEIQMETLAVQIETGREIIEPLTGKGRQKFCCVAFFTENVKFA